MNEDNKCPYCGNLMTTEEQKVGRCEDCSWRPTIPPKEHKLMVTSLHVQVTCLCCNGTGTIFKVNVEALRKVRKLRGVSVRELARRAKYSAAYVSDVELGRRNCSTKLLTCYQEMHLKNMGTAVTPYERDRPL